MGLSGGTLAALYSVTTYLIRRLMKIEKRQDQHEDEVLTRMIPFVMESKDFMLTTHQRLDALEHNTSLRKMAPPPPDPVGPDPTDLLSGVAGFMDMSAERLEHIAAGLSHDQSTGLLLRDEAAKLRRMSKDVDPDGA